MKLVLVHWRASTLELARHPSFSIPTLLFPTLFFLAFGAPRAGRHANGFLASYTGFAVLGVAFFQFGVGIANDRASPWEQYLRTLPAGVGKRFAARLLSALVFGLASAALVACAAVAFTDVSLRAEEWLALGGALLLGSVPFALLGIAIGYWVSPKGALPLANVLYLALAFAGGLFGSLGDLPHAVRVVSPYLPTRHWEDALVGATTGSAWDAGRWLVLGAYALGFGALAAWGYARDEGQRFR
jgi:ABC-2 type transport system permease protein